jgi:hypothetical protein
MGEQQCAPEQGKGGEQWQTQVLPGGHLLDFEK